METAFFTAAAKLPQPSAEQPLEALRAAQRHYAANGYTTVQDGADERRESRVVPARRERVPAVPRRGGAAGGQHRRGESSAARRGVCGAYKIT